MITQKEFSEGWSHFCKCINFGDSALDADAIQFMNEVPARVNETLGAAPDLLAACKQAVKYLGGYSKDDTIGKLDAAIAKVKAE